MKKFYQCILLSILCVGCKVGPVYRQPCLDIPSSWQNETSPSLNCEIDDELAWWESLGDSTLNELMDYAAQQNLDLKIAAIRVLQARIEANGKKWDLYPRIDGSMSSGHIYYSKDALVNGLIGLAVPVNPDDVKRNVNFYEVGFDAEWEIDLFGLTAHEIAALKANEEAVRESLCNVWVTLSAEIARNYIELRGLQKRREIVSENIQAETEILTMKGELLERELISKRDYSRAVAEWNTLKSEILLIDVDISRAIHRLSILLGYPPGELFECLCSIKPLPTLPCEMPIGVPSELLRRRPDVRKAERELAMATERIGSAVASLFPRFSLRGFIGEISTHSGSLFSSDSATYFAGPFLLVPIFNSRLILQDIKYNRLETQAALYNYQKTVLEALEESENSIVAFRTDEERYCDLKEAYENYQKTFDLTSELYSREVIDNFEVINTKKMVLSAEDSLIQSQVHLLLSYISLYKSLGGSWKSDCVPLEMGQ